MDYEKLIEISFFWTLEILRRTLLTSNGPLVQFLNPSQSLLHLLEPYSRAEHNQSMRIDNASRRVGLREKQGKLFCFVYIRVQNTRKTKAVFVAKPGTREGEIYAKEAERNSK